MAELSRDELCMAELSRDELCEAELTSLGWALLAELNRGKSSTFQLRTTITFSSKVRFTRL